MLKIIYVLCLLCAYSSARRNARIMGGTEAELGQFPSIVSINIDFEGLMHFCGASIVDKQWIVTAAHCTPDLANYDHSVLTDSLNPIKGGNTYNISKIIPHENYSGDPSYFNDIALLKLETEIVLSDTAQITEIGESVGNDSCSVVGWGATEDTMSPDALLYANLTALTEEDCARLAEGGSYNTERGPGQVCAFGGNGTSPCYGDSGGPLICDNKLVGVVSYAIEPCAQGYPDVYTRVAYYADWIKTTINNN